MKKREALVEKYKVKLRGQSPIYATTLEEFNVQRFFQPATETLPAEGLASTSTAAEAFATAAGTGLADDLTKAETTGLLADSLTAS